MAEAPSSLEWRCGILAILTVGVLLSSVACWPPHALPTSPMKRALATAEPWMADALPGIGPKRRIAAAAALRRGDVATLPTATRQAVPQLFVMDEAPRSAGQ